MNQQIAQIYVDKLIKFIISHHCLSQAHMVDYFTHNLYKKCIPVAIQNDINSIGYHQALDIIFSNKSGKNVCDLQNYMQIAKSFALYNMTDLCETKTEFCSSLGLNDENGFKLDVFMKSKKSHEVETLSSVAHNILKKCGTSHLVDIGDGKGYLSSLLAFHHKVPVLGIDGSYINTDSAVKRAQKLEKQWKNVTSNIIKDASNPAHNNYKFYKQVTQLVTEETDINSLVQTIFLEQPDGIGLVGLHTCGNLGPTCIRLFNANENVKSICNVSCCYHLLNESYLADSSMGTITNNCMNFPMSKFIKSKGFTLTRAARMLSGQSIDRQLYNRELPSMNIFYRSILEVLLNKHETYVNNKHVMHVGKFRKEPQNFVDYARKACAKLEITLSETDQELELFCQEYLPLKEQLNVFHLLRTFLAPAIETIILLDRYLFLLEEGHVNVHLVKLFDPVISPRCYGLIAYK